MVGFVRESSEEGRVANQLKPKTPINGSESDKFDFDHYLPELDEFSFASGQPFLDFDAFKDWIEEMDPEKEEANKVEIGNGLQVEHCLDNSVGRCSVDVVQHMTDSENTASVKATLVNVGSAEICCDGDIGELKTPCIDEPCSGVLNDRDSTKFESLGCSIEEELEKVSLGGGAVSSVVTESDTKDTKVAHVGGEDDNSSSSESECEPESESESGISSSSSSSATFSSESDDDGEEEEEKGKDKSCNIMTGNTKQKGEVEEGEIMGSDVEKMVSWSDNDDDVDNDNDDDDDEPGEDLVVGDVDDDKDVTTGPIKSKNELVDLPPVPPVNVTLQPCHQILPVGVVLSVLGPQVIVEGSEKHNPLSEGSILWITEKRSPLGLVDEIFGPVKTPYYIVRYNSENEVPAGIQTGTLVGFVPEFVDHVLNDKNLYRKGYDASGENDEEVLDEFEFSDDEKEAEYKRMMKMSKRGNNNNNNNEGPGNKRKNRRNPKSQDKMWMKDLCSAPQVQSGQLSQFNQGQQLVSAPPPSSLSQGNQSGLSLNAPILPPGPNRPTSFPLQAQAQVPAGFLFNGSWANGMPIQQQNMGFPAGFQINGMPWLQPQIPPVPNPLQMPSMNPIPWQQQQPFDLSQLVSGSNTSPITPMNFATGPGNSPWPGMLGPNLSSNQAPLVFPGPSAMFPLFQGMQPNGPRAGHDCNSQPAASFPGNVGARPQFNRGSSSNAGRGRKPFHHRGGGGGGRFGGGRGRPQSK